MQLLGWSDQVHNARWKLIKGKKSSWYICKMSYLDCEEDSLIINKLVGKKIYESKKNKVKKKEKIYERRRWKYLNSKPYLLI